MKIVCFMAVSFIHLFIETFMFNMAYSFDFQLIFERFLFVFFAHFVILLVNRLNTWQV